MKKAILISVLTFLFFNSFAQQPPDTTLTKNKIITYLKKGSGTSYLVGGEKVKNLKSYLLMFPESTQEYKKSRNNFTASLISMGIGVAGLTTIIISKDKATIKGVSLYVNIPALAGMIYFGIKHKKHLKKAIDNYNKRVSF
jgi:hypothetical protein